MKKYIKKHKVVFCILLCLLMVVGCRVINYNHTFYLSKEVIAGQKAPNAEETVKLYLYYCNRGEYDKAEKLTTTDFTHKVWLPSIRLVYIIAPDNNNEKKAYFDVVYNEGHFLVTTKKQDKSIDLDFVLENTKDGWKITSIGNG